MSRGTAYLASLIVYAAIGAAAALVEWAVFYALVESRALGYVAAAVGGFVVATGVNYALSRRYGFLPKAERPRGELAAVYAVSAAALLVNLAVLVALVEGAGANMMAAKIAGTGAGFFLNFAGRQFWVFDRRPRHSVGRWREKLRGGRQG